MVRLWICKKFGYWYFSKELAAFSKVTEFFECKLMVLKLVITTLDRSYLRDRSHGENWSIRRDGDGGVWLGEHGAAKTGDRHEPPPLSWLGEAVRYG